MLFDRSAFPRSEAFVLANARVPRCVLDAHLRFAGEDLIKVDIVIAGSSIVAITPAGVVEHGLHGTEIDSGMVLPCFTDMHTHLDKGHICSRTSNLDGTFSGALEAVRRDRSFWSIDDVMMRMEFALRCAFAHGTHLLRTHLDCRPASYHAVLTAFSEVRNRWRDRISLQAVAMFPLDLVDDERFFGEILRLAKQHGIHLGCVTEPGPMLETRFRTLIKAASMGGHDLDLHVDETNDPATNTLATVASLAKETAFEGRIIAGHCCSLALQEADTALRTIDEVAAAQIAIVSLPMCNLYLQDRVRGRTPRWRGVTLLQELAAAGVDTALASDNTRDPFFAYGDLDPVEVLREAIRIMHLDHPLDDVARLVTRTPAGICRAPSMGKLAVGGGADIVVFRGRNWSELLSRPQSDRMVVRSGRLLDAKLPDYRELDTIG